MKHIWVVESTSGKKWRPAGETWPLAEFTKKDAERAAAREAEDAPGLRWRVAKYVRVGG